MTNEAFVSAAKAQGFALCCFLPPVAIAARYPGLVSDPREVIMDARTVILLIKTYCPAGADADAEAVISNYYPASNVAYRAAKALAAFLKENGYEAQSNVQIPLKSWLNAFGIGEAGRNSLIAIDGIGSAFHVQAIVTNAAFKYTHTRKTVKPLADRCLTCSNCIRACPTGAIRENGGVDAEKCLRAISEMDPVPEAYEKMLKNRLLGCDLCQSVCPANFAIKREKPLSVSLKKLLDGDIEEMKQLIGPNYARTNRLKKKAALIAANTHRYDLVSKLEAMSNESDEGLKSAARRALKRLEEEKCE